MDKYQELKDILSATSFTNDWDRYTLIVKYIMKTIKGLRVINEQENWFIYQLQQLLMKCECSKIGNFFVANIVINEGIGTVKINLDDYFNKKSKKIVCLPVLINDLNGQIGNVIKNILQTNVAAASIQYKQQPSNVPQQQLPTVSSSQYYPPNYSAQLETASPPTQLQTSFNDRLVRISGVIQAAATVGQPQNMPIPSAGSTGASNTSDLHSYYYTGYYPNSPQSNLQYQQQQHQPTNQPYGYGSRPNIPSQQTSSIGLSNNTSRSTLTSGQSIADYGGLPSRTLQYTSNNLIPTAYTYETPNTWIPDPQQIPFYQIQSQQTTSMHSNTYEASAYVRQQDSDTMQQNNYNR
ncbi:unnamed protein product [Rotaria sp. Silwood2]|nr:unnamed protein product [Rotaria sp. Silwood2]